MGMLIWMGLTVIIALLLGLDLFLLGCAAVIGLGLGYIFGPKKPQ